MRNLKWNSSMGLGITSIDQEHQQIVHIINHLLYQIASGNVADLKRDIYELLEYSKKHFHHEEELFEEFGYPDLEEHKKQHEIFVEKINKFSELLDTKEVEVTIESSQLDEQLAEIAFKDVEKENEKMVIASNMTRYLFDWLINHILKEDKKYAELFRRKGAV